MARGLKPWQLFAALAIFAIILIAVISPQSLNISNNNQNQTGKVVVTKPLQLGCVDPLAAANCGAVTVKLYQGTSNTLLETLTATSSGVATSTNSYTSGQQLTLAISGNSKATEYVPFSVPTGYVTDTNLISTVYAVTLGAWTQTFTGTGGTTFVTGNTYALAQFSGSSLTITASISETTSNAGYKASYDIVNLLNQYWLIQIDDGGGASSSTQYATVSGLPHLQALGNTHYNFVVCPDGLSGSGVATPFTIVSGHQSSGLADSICTGSLSAQTLGVQAFGGAAGYSFSLATGSLTGGNVETFQFKMYYYGDWNYFVANGNLGPNAAQSGSTFTIKIRS